MKDGIYAVVFESSLQSVGEGIAVVSGGRVHGGDIGFTCRGKLTPPCLELEVSPYSEDIPSTLGIEGNYTLEMCYQESGEGEYHFSGHVRGCPERHLDAHAVFLTPLLE